MNRERTRAEEKERRERASEREGDEREREKRGAKKGRGWSRGVTSSVVVCCFVIITSHPFSVSSASLFSSPHNGKWTGDHGEAAAGDFVVRRASCCEWKRVKVFERLAARG